MKIERSNKGKKAKSVFYHSVNSIDIYVEDTSKGTKKIYTDLISRAIGSDHKVEEIFPLGNKLAVIEQCRNDQNKQSNRKKLYIIDGDLDLLTDTNPKGLNNLYILKRYCIENYLVDEDAIINILHEEDIDKEKEDIKNEFNFSKWIEANEEGLFNLFIYYSIAKKYIPHLMTVSFSVNSMVSSNNGLIDSQKLSSRLTFLYNKISKEIGNTRLDQEIESLKRKADENNFTTHKYIRYISGKNYLLPLIFQRMRKVTQFTAKNIVLKQRLAFKCQVDELFDMQSFL